MTGRGLLLLWAVLSGADLDLAALKRGRLLEEELMVDLTGLTDDELMAVKRRLVAECEAVEAVDDPQLRAALGRDVGLLVVEINRRVGGGVRGEFPRDAG